MEAYGTSFPEIFETQADIENIISYKLVEKGDRTETDATPRCILTPRYSRVRVAFKTKNLVEAEAIDMN
jgi:hypothetical protein